VTPVTDHTLDAAKQRIRLKMERRGIAVDAVRDFLQKVQDTQTQTSFVPLRSVTAPDPDRILDFPFDPALRRDLDEQGRLLLERVAIVKLNGGRSTTMGGRVPKGILSVKFGQSYLEIIMSQVKALRENTGLDIPLVLMNSFFTHGPTMEIVDSCGLPVYTFLQNQVPRLREDTLEPLETGTDADWAPPGHGDVYGSLLHSGLLGRLLARGCRWAFISNLDNLAAYPEPWIVGLLEREGIDFLLEVTDRTLMDRKGGTLVMRDGRLDLIEIAQVSPEERDSFMDIDRFRVFNTNNVWIDLAVLSDTLKAESLNLPLIQNHKVIAETKVIQLETAMGAAIGCFPRARGLRVSRDRFFPTKKVADLFVLQSDVCLIDSMYRLRRNPQRPDSLPFMPRVSFSSDFLETPDQLYDRFQDPGSVSLLLADSLEVSGPAVFEANVKIEGRVRIDVPNGREYRVRAGSVLRDGVYP
jgi:UTP--glucose-1-phosphate uridylyltransferase